jgi:putative ABC transport system substrate-binding protein
MKRRDFISLLGGAAAAWPLAARAQQPALPVVGVVHLPSPDTYRKGSKKPAMSRARMCGSNTARRKAKTIDRLPALAADLVQRRVTVIVATSGPAARAAKAATSTIPIVFQAASDAVEFGLVNSLNRPGGNLTGVSSLNMEVGPKRLELMHDLIPMATTMTLLINPTNPSAEAQSRDLQTAAQTLGLQLHVLRASNEHDFDTVFATSAQLRASGLVIAIDGLFNSRMERLAALAVRNGLPAISAFSEFAEAGGLMAYGASSKDSYRQVGVYVGRILKGEKPADLPVVQSTKVELVINLKTAKALGLEIPARLLARADEVIE